MIIIKLLASILVLNAVFAEYRNFTDYKVLRISPRTKLQIDLVEQWQHNPDFDVWSVETDHIDACLSPAAFELYTGIMEKNGINFVVLNDNIQRNIEREQREVKAGIIKATNLEQRVLANFAKHGDINAWLDQLAKDYTFVSSYSIGKTSGGRDLRVIKIDTGKSNGRKIWIDCGIHAREWISPATCLWMINELVTKAQTTGSDADKVLQKYVFHILPVHNPDGYEYTFTNDRLWRKNRKTNSGSTCIGVDLNRNFGYQWMVAGASSNPCAETYAGPVRDSELETQAVEAEINNYKGQWDAFFTIHTYGQYWFTPWGYTSALPSDYQDLVAKSNVGVAALKAVNGAVFRVGSSTNLLYAAAGGSDDWAKATAGIKYSHCLELRPGDSGADAGFGFQLPFDRVAKSGPEVYQGIVAFSLNL